MTESSVTKESFMKWYKSIGLKYVDESLKSCDEFYYNAIQEKNLSFSLLNYQYLYFKYVDESNYSKWVENEKIPSKSIDEFEQFSESGLNEMILFILYILKKEKYFSLMRKKLYLFTLNKEKNSALNKEELIKYCEESTELNLLCYILVKITKIRVFDIYNNSKQTLDNNEVIENNKVIVKLIYHYFSLKHFYPKNILDIKRSYNYFATVCYWYDCTIKPYKYYFIIHSITKNEHETLKIIGNFMTIYIKHYKKDFELDSLKEKLKSLIEKGIYSESGDVKNEMLRIAGKQNEAFENFKKNIGDTFYPDDISFYPGDIRIETSKEFNRKKTVIIADNPKIQIVLSHHYEAGNKEPDSKNKGYSIFIRTDDIEVSQENEIIDYIINKLKENLLPDNFTNKLEYKEFKYSIKYYKTFTVNEKTLIKTVSLDQKKDHRFEPGMTSDETDIIHGDNSGFEVDMTSDETDITDSPIELFDNNFIPNSVLIETVNQIINELKTFKYNIHIFQSLMGLKAIGSRMKNQTHKLKIIRESLFVGNYLKCDYRSLTDSHRKDFITHINTISNYNPDAPPDQLDQSTKFKIKQFVKDTGISIHEIYRISEKLKKFNDIYHRCFILIANDTLGYIENHSIIQLLSKYPTFFKEKIDHIVKIFNDNASNYPIKKNKAVFFDNLAKNLRKSNLLPEKHGGEQSSSFLETIYNKIIKIINSKDSSKTKLLKHFSEKTGIHT